MLKSKLHVSSSNCPRLCINRDTWFAFIYTSNYIIVAAQHVCNTCYIVLLIQYVITILIQRKYVFIYISIKFSQCIATVSCQPSVIGETNHHMRACLCFAILIGHLFCPLYLRCKLEHFYKKQYDEFNILCNMKQSLIYIFHFPLNNSRCHSNIIL